MTFFSSLLYSDLLLYYLLYYMNSVTRQTSVPGQDLNAGPLFGSKCSPDWTNDARLLLFYDLLYSMTYITIWPTLPWPTFTLLYQVDVNSLWSWPTFDFITCFWLWPTLHNGLYICTQWSSCIMHFLKWPWPSFDL